MTSINVENLRESPDQYRTLWDSCDEYTVDAA